MDITVHKKIISTKDIKSILDLEMYWDYPFIHESELIKKIKNKYSFITAEINDCLIGYVLFIIKKESVELERLLVHPDFRRLGVGTSLLKELKKYSIKKPLIYRGMVNREASLFFKKHNFYWNNDAVEWKNCE